MSEYDNQFSPWAVAILLAFLVAFGMLIIDQSRINNLQRRVGQLEQQVGR